MIGKRVCLLCENNRSDEGQGLWINFRSHYDKKENKKWVCMPCVIKIKEVQEK